VIREYQPSDAEAIAESLARGQDGVLTARGIRHVGEASPAQARLATWVATNKAGVVGWAYAHLKSSADLGVAFLRVVVSPEERGRGVGSALWSRAEAHVLSFRPHKLTTSADDTPESNAFVRHRGLTARRRSIISSLDLDDASILELELPANLALAPLRRIAGREREIFELFLAAERDVPADKPPENC